MGVAINHTGSASAAPDNGDATSRLAGAVDESCPPQLQHGESDGDGSPRAEKRAVGPSRSGGGAGLAVDGLEGAPGRVAAAATSPNNKGSSSIGCMGGDGGPEEFVQRLFRFAVEIWSGPSDGPFANTKVCLSTLSTLVC
jgi:hypothetical protein